MADTDVIYGWFPFHETLAVVPAADAERAALVVRRVQAATTVGDLKAVYAEFGDEQLPAPQDDVLDGILEGLGDDVDEVPDDTAFDWQELPGVVDGDWPRMPSQLTLSLPREVLAEVRALPGVEREDTVLNGDFLVIPESTETSLVEVLRKHGLTPRRDDAVIYDLAGGDPLFG